MKAFLLAAGLGTRLRPLTAEIPKCLVPVNGTPLLQIWLELLARHGVSDVLVNTHYLPQKVQEFASTWAGPPRVHLSFEETLLGSAGTLRKEWDFVASEPEFLVCHADTLTDIDLGRLIDFHRLRHALLTMTLFPSDRPTECGIAEMDKFGRVVGFEEKPSNPKSCLANGGVYVMHQDILTRLPSKPVSDIAFDLLPKCLGQMHGFLWDGVLIDIGNPNNYARAQNLWGRRRMACGNAAT